MSKNLESLLKNLGVENVEEIKTILLSEEDNSQAVSDILKAAQGYARPFIEGELTDKFKTERGQLKGKYMKETLNMANKVFGNALTNKEIEDVLNDPENSGKTIDKALELLKEKVSTKTGASETDLQKMLEAANAKIDEYEKAIPEITSKAQKEAQDAINKFKLDGVLSTKLISILDGKTAMPASKAAELIRGQLSSRALLQLKEDGNIGLYKLGSEGEHLKKNDTTLHTIESLVEDIVSEFELAKKSGGTEVKPLPSGGQTPEAPKGKQPASAGLAAKMEQIPIGN